MSANIGDPITKKFTSGRLYAKYTSIYPPPSGFAADTFFRDFGNTEDYKYDPKVSRKEHMKSAAGLKTTDLSLISDISPKFTFTFDEFTTDLENLLGLGTQGSDAVQAGGNIANESMTTNSQQGRVYFTANQGISAVVLKMGATTMTLGVDYTYDAGSGAVTIVNGGGIINGSTVTVSYTAAAITQHVITGYQQLIVMASCKVLEYDQFSSTSPRQINTFNGQLYVTNWGDNKQDYSKITVEALVLGALTINRRAD